MIRRPPRSTLFPSTTLSRSAFFKCSSSGIRRRRSVLATTIDERLLKPVRGDQSQDSNLLALISACHVLPPAFASPILRSEEHTSELQSHLNLVCRLLLEKKK